MEDLTIKVAEYEGPMDVLLHLIREMKIDIYDIPMNELTKQYLNFIHSMKTLELEVAAEYLVMASTLLEIKARIFQNQSWRGWMKTGSQSWKTLVIS